MLIYLIVIRVRKKTQHGNVTRHFNLSMEEYFTEHKKKNIKKKIRRLHTIYNEKVTLKQELSEENY